MGINIIVNRRKQWAVRFRDYAKKAYNIDFTGPPPPINENIVDWQEQNTEHSNPDNVKRRYDIL